MCSFRDNRETALQGMNEVTINSMPIHIEVDLGLITHSHGDAHMVGCI